MHSVRCNSLISTAKPSPRASLRMNARRYSVDCSSTLTFSHILKSVEEMHRSAHDAAAQVGVGRTAGLQLCLPPCYTWGDSGEALCRSLSAYTALLSSGQSSTRGHHPRGASPPPPPPIFTALRLFPDMGNAQIARPHRRVPHHRVWLESFMLAEDPWPSRVSPQHVFQRTLRTLREIAESVTVSSPVLLIIPTRMLVTQSFCEELFELVRQLQWAGIAFELPPTPILYDTVSPPSDVKRSKAYDDTWCRLSTLCCSWQALQSQPRYKNSLRNNLTRHSLLPVHVLLPWILHEGLLAGVDVSTVVDTTAPFPGTAFTQAAAESPDGAGVDAVPSGELSSDKDAAVRTFVREVSSRAARAATTFDTAAVALRQKAKDSAAHNKSGLDTTDVEASIRRTQKAVAAERDMPLSLDVPSESLKQMILNSVNHDDKPAASFQDGMQSERSELFAQVGRFIQHTMQQQHDGDDGTDVDEKLIKEADDLERLLKGDGQGGLSKLSGKQSESSPVADNTEGDAASHLADMVASWAGSADRDEVDARGYWLCMRKWLSVSRTQTVLTMPTLAAQQVKHWTRTLHGDSISAQKVPVIPVVMPSMPAAELEAHRLLREGRVIPSLGQRDDAASEANSRWLPQALGDSLADTLGSLPTAYVDEGKRSVLDAHRAAEAEEAVTSAMVTDQEGDGYVVRQHKALRRPFWYYSPDEVERTRLQAARSSQRQREGSSGRDAVLVTEKEFQSRGMIHAIGEVCTTCGTDSGGVVSLVVPIPGSSRDTITTSWQSLFSK